MVAEGVLKGSMLREGFIEVQQHQAKARPGGVLRRRELFIARRFAGGGDLLRGLYVPLEAGAESIQAGDEERPLGIGRKARRGESKGQVDSRALILASGVQDALRLRPRRLRVG